MWIFPFTNSVHSHSIAGYINWEYTATGLSRDIRRRYTNTERQLLHLELILFTWSLQNPVHWKSVTDCKPCRSPRYHIWLCLGVPLHTVVLVLTWNSLKVFSIFSWFFLSFQHSTFWILMSGCWMSSLYFIYCFKENMQWLWSEHRNYLLGKKIIKKHAVDFGLIWWWDEYLPIKKNHVTHLWNTFFS